MLNSAFSKFSSFVNTVTTPKVEVPPGEDQDMSGLLWYEQNYKNSCGAAGLLTIACEMGVPEMTTLPGSYHERKLGSCQARLSLAKRCEMDIYMMTSNIGSSEEEDLENAGYSMPNHIVSAARAMGLKSEVREKPGVYAAVLNNIYPEACEGLLADGIEIKNSNEPLKEGELEMKAMAVTGAGIPAGLHWVVARPDGTYMDPANGKNYSSFERLKDAAPAGTGALSGMGALGSFLEKNCISYDDTGISIVFSKAEAADAGHS
jgi:hypothetical protein